MRSLERSGTFEFGGLRVRRLGDGAMHLSGAGIFGPPENRDAALAVLREAVAAGVNHIDTSHYYGPHITNQSAWRFRSRLMPRMSWMTTTPGHGLAPGGVATWADRSPRTVGI